ncbi:MAG TPA: transaldolase family protein, partial [Chlamydiales bacterium]|nr:transaldolase family protein [Chlamydiales bacterium]
NKAEIVELAGCDLLTIAPEFLEELKTSQEPIERKLDPEKAKKESVEKLEIDEKAFRYLLNEDPMATDKLAEGIRNFAKDLIKLEGLLQEKLR